MAQHTLCYNGHHFICCSWGHTKWQLWYSKVTQLYPEKHSSLEPRIQLALLDHIHSVWFVTPLPATLWYISYERFVSSLCMMTNGSSPRSYSPLVTQLTFLTLWPLCPTEKRLLITGSYFSCTFGEMGNKKIKGTHWGKITSELNCWYNMDAGIMSQMQFIGRRKYKWQLSL